MKRPPLLLLALAAATLLPSPASPDGRAFTLDDGLALNRFVARMSVDLTPDGRFLAYGLQSKSSGLDTGGRHYLPTGAQRMVAGAEIRVDDLESGTSRHLTGQDTSWAPRWSPDGSRLAFFSDRSGKPLLYVWDRRRDETKAIDGAVVRTFFPFEVPEWSPDGRFVYYRALAREHEDRYGESPESWPWEGIPVKDEKPDAKDAATTPAFVTIYDARHGRRPAAPGDGTPPPAETAEGAERRGRGIIDVVRADLATGEVVRLLCGFAVRTLDLAPDGRRLLVSVQLGVEAAGAQQPLFAFYVTDAAAPGCGDAAPAPLVDEVRGGYGISVAWSPDSTRLAYATVGPLAAGDVYVVDAASGERRNLTDRLDANLGEELETYDPPLWTPDARRLLWLADGELWRIAVADGEAVCLSKAFAPRLEGLVRPSESGTAWLTRDGRAVLAQTSSPEGDLAGFARLDLETGAAEQLLEARRDLGGGGATRYHLEVAEATGTIVYRAEDHDAPSDLWTADETFHAPRRATGVNPHLGDVDLGDVRLLEWTLASGENARGILLVPRGTTADAPVPLVMWIYGGSRPSARYNTFGLSGDPVGGNPRLFTGRGFGVFLPDLPLAGHDPLAGHARAVLPALDAVIATGLVDPERVGVFGHSYGGYGVNAIITQTDRFAAAVSSTGVSNLVSHYLQSAFRTGITGWFETGQGAMGVPLWEDFQRYVEGSPVFHLDRVTTPLLLVHSEDDGAYQQSVEMYGGLRRLGKDVVLASYKDAHHYYGAWSRDKLADFWERVLGWFETYLRGSP